MVTKKQEKYNTAEKLISDLILNEKSHKIYNNIHIAERFLIRDKN